MREIVVISGKGGTGKTSLTAAFAMLAKQSVICDADVDAADLHLLLQPQIQQRTDFLGGGLAVIDRLRCTECGRCRELCRFGAVTPDYEVDSLQCEGCGVCVDLCPEQAIDFPVQTCGEWYLSTTRVGPMVHARLGIAEENSGKLVSLVRQQAREVAVTKKLELILTDGPPGVGCPVIASIGGATVLVIVAEPTLSGLHDMNRVIDLAAHFKVPGMVLVNKYDLNLEVTGMIEEHARKRNVMVLGRVPFDPDFVRAMVAGKNIIEHREDGTTAQAVAQIWQGIFASPVMSMAGIRNMAAAIQ
jgi:MinD superfamily P-loop ATPase